MNVGRKHSVLGRHMGPKLLSLPGAGHERLTLKSRRQDKHLPSQVLWSLLPLHIPLSGFTSLLTPGYQFLIPSALNSSAHCFLFPHPRMRDAVSFTVDYSFLAGNAVLIRINIWVLFTGLQSARIAWGIQFHKLS